MALMDVAAHWTAAGKEELADLYKHSVEIPMDRIDAGLKRGKLVFPWLEFKPWVKQASGNSLPQIADDYEVDLPLAIIAPRYLRKKLRRKRPNAPCPVMIFPMFLILSRRT